FGFTFDPVTNPFVVTRRPIEAGPRRFEQNVNTFYLSGGLDGHVDVGDRRFLWDATLAYGINRGDQLRHDSFNSAKLQQPLGPAHRRLSGCLEPARVVAAGDGADVPALPTSGSYSVSEAYAELRAPLVAGKKGIELFDLNAAGRVSDYSFLDPELTGKIGAR